MDTTEPTVQSTAPAADVVTQEVMTETTTEQPEAFDAERAQALITKLRGEVKTLKPFEKQAAEYARLQKEQAEKDLTELQKAQKRISELEAETKANARREMQRAAAAKYKLPDAVAELIPGETADDIDKKALELSKAIPTKTVSLSPTNPGAGVAAVIDEQRRAFMFGQGPLPGA